MGYEGKVEWVPVAGGSIWTTTSGHGTPLVLCHGGPCGYDDLDLVAQLVDDIALVHRFDQRGGGRTQSVHPPTIAGLIRDIEALRSHWHHERWIVVGHSWGAHLALFYALEHPERVAGLVFLSGPDIEWGWGPARRAKRLAKLTSEEQAEVARLELSSSAERPERLLDLWWLTDFADRTHAQRHRRPIAYPRDRSIVEQLEREWRAELDGISERVARLDAPVLVLHGEGDPIPAPSALGAGLPDGRLVVLPSVGHNPWLEDPTALRAQLREFVTALSRDERAAR